MIKNRSALEAVGDAPARKTVPEVMEASLQALNARRIIRGLLRVEGNTLQIGQCRWNLASKRRVIADTAPRQIAGLTAGVFNTFDNIAAITTPVVIGYIVQATDNFKGAVVFLAANALATVFSYLVIAGPIRRLEIDQQAGAVA